MQIQEQAAAKVNLCLAVEYPPQQGYHRLASVFQALDLHDTLVFSTDVPSRAALASPTQKAQASAQAQTQASQFACTQLGSRVHVRCSALDLATQDNLVFKAIDAIEQCVGEQFWGGEDVHISIDKHIPAGGGLGGGSSNAAAALRAYARVHGLETLDERCVHVAQGIGADVAFFLYGGAAHMTGRGDVLNRRLPAFPLPCVLMGAEKGNATVGVYAAFDADPHPAPDAHALARAMEHFGQEDGPSPSALAKLCANNLEPAACAARPELAQRIQRALDNPLVLNALVTGSGSTSYAICADEQAAEKFAREIAPHCAWARVARGV